MIVQIRYGTFTRVCKSITRNTHHSIHQSLTIITIITINTITIHNIATAAIHVTIPITCTIIDARTVTIMVYVS